MHSSEFILHMSTNDGTGGAGLAAYRIFSGFRNRGISGKLLVLHKSGKDIDVIPMGLGKFGKFGKIAGLFLEYLVLKSHLAKKLDIYNSGLIGVGAIGLEYWIKKADAIILYWVAGGFISHKNIQDILKSGKPVIWRMSDMWPFTGGCHYSYSCRKFKTGCRICPLVRSSRFPSLPETILADKKRLYSSEKRNLLLIATNPWMKEQARESGLFNGAKCDVIHTGVDLDIFRPTRRYNDPDKSQYYQKRILIGAQNLKFRRKGFTELIDILKAFSAKYGSERIRILSFGKKVSLDRHGISIEHEPLGHIDGSRDMANVYNKADVFLIPSIIDNLPNTGIEALACGVPIVGFDIGGVRDLVLHQKTGYLVKPFDIIEAADRIYDVLFKSDWLWLSHNSRVHAEKSFDGKAQIDKLVSLIHMKQKQN